MDAFEIASNVLTVLLAVATIGVIVSFVACMIPWGRR